MSAAAEEHAARARTYIMVRDAALRPRSDTVFFFRRVFGLLLVWLPDLSENCSRSAVLNVYSCCSASNVNMPRLSLGDVSALALGRPARVGSPPGRGLT